MSTLTATPPRCNGGQLCTSINNSDSKPTTVTVDIFVNTEKISKPVTIPAKDAVAVCVKPKTTGNNIVVSVEAGGQQLAVRTLTLPCP